MDEITLPDAEVSDAVTAAGGLFEMVQIVFYLIGAVILLIVVFRVAKLFAKGDMSGVAKTAIGGVIAAILCFNLNLPISLVNSAGGFAQNIFDAISNVANTGTDDAPPAPAPTPDPT